MLEGFKALNSWCCVPYLYRTVQKLWRVRELWTAFRNARKFIEFKPSQHKRKNLIKTKCKFVMSPFWKTCIELHWSKYDTDNVQIIQSSLMGCIAGVIFYQWPLSQTHSNPGQNVHMRAANGIQVPRLRLQIWPCYKDKLNHPTLPTILYNFNTCRKIGQKGSEFAMLSNMVLQWPEFVYYVRILINSVHTWRMESLLSVVNCDTW